MTDKIDAARRSANMRAIRSKNTKPELTVRKLLHGLGYRYRLHRKDLPGKPDIVFGPRRKIVLVHGCYWHGHGCAVGGTGAKSNTGYWEPKIARNRERDERVAGQLSALGWQVLVVWECETRDLNAIRGRVLPFLDRA